MIQEMETPPICRNCKHKYCGVETHFHMLCRNPKFCEHDLIYGGVIPEFCFYQRSEQATHKERCGKTGTGFETL